VTETQENDSKQKYQREEYVSRINRVIDYIEANIDIDLSLENLAKVANFSRFHFHRIFRAMVGETLNQFIQRIRLEKAAAQLIVNPKKSITEIAFDYGFSGSAAFARAFKETFQMNASEWRSEGHLQDRKIRKTNSKVRQSFGKIRKDVDVSSYYIDNETKNLIWRIKMKNKKQIQVKVKDLPEFHVAYVRHIGPYKGNSELFEKLFEKLMKWAGPRGLLRFPENKVLRLSIKLQLTADGGLWVSGHIPANCLSRLGSVRTVRTRRSRTALKYLKSMLFIRSFVMGYSYAAFAASFHQQENRCQKVSLTTSLELCR
jgi:AraC-like DNA-binding protein